MLILHDEQNAHISRKGRTPAELGSGGGKWCESRKYTVRFCLILNFDILFLIFIIDFVCIFFFRKEYCSTYLDCWVVEQPFRLCSWVGASHPSLALRTSRNLSQGKLEGSSQATHPDTSGSGELSNFCIRKCSSWDHWCWEEAFSNSLWFDTFTWSWGKSSWWASPPGGRRESAEPTAQWGRDLSAASSHSPGEK